MKLFSYCIPMKSSAMPDPTDKEEQSIYSLHVKLQYFFGRVGMFGVGWVRFGGWVAWIIAQ